MMIMKRYWWGGMVQDHAAQAEYDSKKQAEYAKEQKTEQLIIKHTEKATGTKAIEVDGELKYIPIKDAKRLGLL